MVSRSKWMIISNILFFLSGASLFIVGLWLRFGKDLKNMLKSGESLPELADISNLLFIASLVLIAVGVIAFVAGVLGCIGARKESTRLINIYLAFIVVVFAGALAGGIYAYANYEKVLNSSKIGETLKNYNVTANTDQIEKPWNFLMIKFDCCGWTDTSHRIALTDACCYHTDAATKYVYGDGIAGKGVCTAVQLAVKASCYEVFTHFLKDKSVTVIAVAGCMAGLQVLVLVLALRFCCTLGDD